jgi:hypothetical protein
MRVRELEVLQRPRDGDRLLVVEHREGMMGVSLETESGDREGDEGDSQGHGVFPVECALRPGSIV